MTRPIQRVYLVVWWFDRLGGMERHVTEMALAIARAGIEVIIFSELPVPRSNAYGRTLRSAGIRIMAPGQIRALARRVEKARIWTTARGVRHVDRIVYRLLHRDSPINEVQTKAQEVVDQRGDYNLLTRQIMRSLAEHALEWPPDVIHLH